MVMLICFYLNSVMTTWVALPSAGGMGETASLDIRVEWREDETLQLPGTYRGESE